MDPTHPWTFPWWFQFYYKQFLNGAHQTHNIDNEDISTASLIRKQYLGKQTVHTKKQAHINFFLEMYRRVMGNFSGVATCVPCESVLFLLEIFICLRGVWIIYLFLKLWRLPWRFIEQKGGIQIFVSKMFVRTESTGSMRHCGMATQFLLLSLWIRRYT